MRVVLGVAIVLLIVLWVYVRRREAEPGKEEDKTQATLPTASEVARKSTPYHAVSIKIGPNACGAAQAMQGKRFLSGAAPRLPLPECNVLDCKCRFVHYADRRTGKDRRSSLPRGFGSSGSGKYPEERRKRHDRRHDDEDDVDSYF